MTSVSKSNDLWQLGNEGESTEETNEGANEAVFLPFPPTDNKPYLQSLSIVSVEEISADKLIFESDYQVRAQLCVDLSKFPWAEILVQG